MVSAVTKLRADDAKNRALRTFLQGLAFDVLVTLAIVLYTVFDDANGWGDLEWKVIAFTVFKTVLMATFAYIMRRFIDNPGSIALPQDPPGEPSEPARPPFPPGV